MGFCRLRDIAQSESDITLVSQIFGKFAHWWQSLFSPRQALGLEVGAVVKHFDLVGQARKLADIGLPAFHSKTLTSIELEVVRYIEHEREQRQAQTLADLERVDAQISEALSHQYVTQSELLAADFERKAASIFSEQHAWLDKLGSIATRRMAELESFRRKNQCERDAIYPDGSGLFFRYAVLFLLITFEGLFNAGFFAEGLTTGLLGGFLYAVVLAALNVLTAFMLGKVAVRWMFHIQPGLKTLGLLALGLTLSFTTLMALSIGHLRSAILMQSTNPTQDAWFALITTPLGLHDMMAWLLFLVTIGFGIAAMIDGLYVDDLYPGYGDVTRRAKLAVEEFEDEFEEVRASLEEAKQDNMDALDQEIVVASQRAQRVQQLLDEKKAIYAAWLKLLNDSEIVLFAVLRTFRSENTRHRSDAMRPAYFDTLPTLRQLAVAKPDVSQQEQNFQALVEKTRSLEQSLNTRRAKVHDMFNQHIDQLNYIKQAQDKVRGVLH